MASKINVSFSIEYFRIHLIINVSVQACNVKANACISTFQAIVFENNVALALTFSHIPMHVLKTKPWYVSIPVVARVYVSISLLKVTLRELMYS